MISAQRFQVLDMARGLAALGVVIAHMPSVGFQLFQGLPLLVDFFFVLSGFVLYPTYPQNRKITRFKFIYRRSLRLFPVTWVSLALSVAVLFAQALKEKYSGDFGVSQVHFAPTYSLILAALLLQVFSQPAGSWSGALWSLSAEWVVNFTYVFIKFKTTIFLLLALIGMCLVGYGVFSESGSVTVTTGGFFGIGRAIAGFSLGLFVRKIFSERQPDAGRNLYKTHSWLFVVILPVALLVLGGFSDFPFIIAAPVFAFAVWHLAHLNQEVRSTILTRTLLKLGVISFSFYALHKPILTLLRGVILGAFSNGQDVTLLLWIAIFIITVIATWFAAKLCRKYLEQPINNFARRS